MIKRLVVLAAVLAMVAVATPAQAYTRTRPVTLTASSACLQYQWTVTLVAKSTTTKTVDLYYTSDYGNRLVLDLADVPQSSITLAPNVAVTIRTHPGASAQYAEYGVFPAGSGGWDGGSDPNAVAFARDPVQTNPYATC